MNPIEFFCHLQYVLSFKQFSIILIRKRFFLNNIYIYCLKDLSISYKPKARFTTNRHFLGKPF